MSSQKPKHIIVVGPNIGIGGVERSSCNFSNALVESGAKVTYLALIPKAPFYKLHPEVNYIAPKGFNSKRLNILKTVLFIRGRLKGLNECHIVVYTKLYAALVNMALLFTSKQIIVTERSSPHFSWPLHIEVFSKVSFVLKKPAGSISQTKYASKFHKEYYKGLPNVVIPNVVDLSDTYSNIDRKRWIVGVGRIDDYNKGFDRLIKAFGLIKNDKWHLVIAGGSKEYGYNIVDQSLMDLNRERIHFLGKVQDIAKVYAQAGIFVIPSRSEGFPNALCEAMAAGCPCIAYDFIAGARELISDGKNGLLIQEGDIPGLANAIDYLINNEPKRKEIGKEAQKVFQRLSPSKIASTFIKFIDGLKTN